MQIEDDEDRTTIESTREDITCSSGHSSNSSHHKICEVREVKFISYIYCRYIFSRAFNSFYLLTGLDGDNPLKRPDTTHHGLCSEDVLTLQKIYGPNDMRVNKIRYLEIFSKEIVDSFYLFQIFTITVWFLSASYYYVSGIILITSIVITVALRKMKREDTKLADSIKSDHSITVIRDDTEYYLPYTDLVPGDVVILNKSSDYITFDGIIISGSVFVDNALLTGITKASYRYSQDISYTAGKLDRLTKPGQPHTIFAGTTVVTSQQGSDVLALVVNTGFLTQKGRVLRSVGFEDQYQYSLDKDSLAYGKFLVLIGIGAFCLALVYLLCLPEVPLSGKHAILAACRLVTIAIPPSLPLALTVAFLWSIKRLNREDLVMRNYRRIPVADRVSRIIWDKTGTLTKNNVEYLGRLEVFQEGKTLQLSGIETSTDIPKGDILYLMATCHSLDPKSVGKEHTVDDTMFRVTEWNLVERDGVLKAYSGSIDNLGEYKLSFLQRFPFHSDKQTQSVIVDVEHEGRCVYYTSGAPSKILASCKSKTVPKHTQSMIDSHAKEGYIVIALAFKDIKDKDLDKDRDLQCDLTFLGVIVFGDTLANGASDVIQSLKEAKYTNIMCTGDTLHTAVYVARQVGILPPQGEFRKRDKVVHISADIIPETGDLSVTAVDYDTGMEYTLSSAWGHFEAPPNYVLDGRTFEVLDNWGGSELDRIIKAGKVFASMLPTQKKHLVQLQQKVGYVSCMVGDGSNDNQALRVSDVGISLNYHESGYAAQLYSTKRDIQSVPRVLNEGRTLQSQLLTIFQFSACYSILGMVAESTLYSMFYQMSEVEWIYIDLILVMSIDMMLGYSESRETIITARMSMDFFNSVRLLSMSSFLVTCICIDIIYIFYLEQQPWYVKVLTTSANLTDASMEATYIFLLLIFQLTFPAIVYTMEREPIYKNRFMLALFSIIYSVNSYLDLFPYKLIVLIFEFFVSPSMWFRVQVILIALGNLVVTVVIEILFIYCNLYG